MPLATFNPPVGPSPGTSYKRNMKILKAEFGDGYTQPTPNGINHMRKTLSLAWNGLTAAQKTTIDAFFEARKGVEPFYYQPTGHAAPLKWTCEEWDVQIAEGVWKITATLIQDFTNAT